MGSGKSEPPPPEKKPVESPSATPDYSVTQQRQIVNPDRTASASLLVDDEEHNKAKNLIG